MNGWMSVLVMTTRISSITLDLAASEQRKRAEQRSEPNGIA